MNATLQRPQPIPTAETAHYWRPRSKAGSRSSTAPPARAISSIRAAFCTSCLSDQIEWVQASGQGRVYTYTVCHVAAHPAFESRVPYAIGMIELDEGVRMLAGIVDADLEHLAVGAPVEVCFERISDEIALPMFRLARRR